MSGSRIPDQIVSRDRYDRLSCIEFRDPAPERSVSYSAVAVAANSPAEPIRQLSNPMIVRAVDHPDIRPMIGIFPRTPRKRRQPVSNYRSPFLPMAGFIELSFSPGSEPEFQI